MQWLITALAQLFATLAADFTRRGLAKYAFVLATITIWTGLIIAFILATVASVLALAPIAPPTVSYGLGLLPPEMPVYFSILISTKITKLLYDYYHSRMKQLFLI